MAEYGILRVSAGWEDDEPTYFYEPAYLQYSDDLEEGTHALIYAVDAIVAEIEITEDFAEVEPEFSDADPLPPEERVPTNPTEDRLEWDEGLVFSTPDTAVAHRAYRLPMRVVRSTVEWRPLPKEVVQRLVGDPFLEAEAWLPMEEPVYRALIREWEKLNHKL